MAKMNRRAREIHESAMVGQDTGLETTTRGSSSQQAGMRTVHETTTRGSRRCSRQACGRVRAPVARHGPARWGVD